MATQLQFIIDDNDARLTYSSGWTKAGGENEFQQSTHETEVDGALFTFKFNGTGITVLGTVDDRGQNGPPNSTYTLDDGEPQLRHGPRVQGVAYQQVFFQSSTLSNTEHTLVGACKDAGSRIFLDYLVVTSPTPQPSSAATTVTMIMTVTQSPSTQSTTASSQTQTTTESGQAQNASSQSSASPGLVVGVTISSIAFLMIVVGVILLYWRRVKSRDREVPHFVEPGMSTSSGYGSESGQPLSPPVPLERSMDPPAYMDEFHGRMGIVTSGKRRAQQTRSEALYLPSSDLSA